MRRVVARRGNERGAVAVMVGLLMGVMMGFAALAIDLGAAYSERQQLQNGADAGALAIAQSCLAGSCVDSSGEAAVLLKADKYVKANKLDGLGTGSAEVRMRDGKKVGVTVTATNTHINWFAGILGFPTTQVSASASAEWGYPSGGASLPLTFGWCEFQRATGAWDDQGKPVNETVVTMVPMKEKLCDNPAHNGVPGGFGWLTGTACVSVVQTGSWVQSDPGGDLPSVCKDIDWSGLHDATVLVPIFENARGTGTNAEYQIRGLAAFTITGFCFTKEVQWNMPNCPSEKGVKGHFISYSDISGAYTIDQVATHFGAGTVRLSS